MSEHKPITDQELNEILARCEMCGTFITETDGITTLSGLWVCDNSSCRILDEENQAIEIGDPECTSV